MRYTAEHKDAVRTRIIAAASRRFRQAGFDGVAIGDVMRELKLTHGGFYRHFSSKAELFEDALEAGVIDLGHRLAAVVEASADPPLVAIVDAYLSEAHCDGPGEGCPLAALGGDIARLPRRSRDVCHRLLMTYARGMGRFMPGETEEDRQRYAAALFSAMAGTLTLARTVSDRAARRAVLADGRAFHLRGVHA